MKRVTLPVLSYLVLLLAACQDPDPVQSRPGGKDSVAVPAYRPGLGEFMTGIQIHHAKLWFAGRAANWQLADFEIHEIEEALADIRKYCTDRPEINSLPMIDKPIRSVESSIEKKDLSTFESQYKILTATCNECHRATEHGFNVIKVPVSPPFDNQAFDTTGPN